MTGFNDNSKFIPNIPKTFQVLELKEQQIKKSPLSAAARSKVVQRYGSNYLSENQEYGPCFASFSNDCNCGFQITATLVDGRGNSRSQTIIKPTSYGQVTDMARDVNLGWGEWEVNSGSSFYGTNYFNPSQAARVRLAVEINYAAYRHGPQSITVAENSVLQGITATVNGIRM